VAEYDDLLCASRYGLMMKRQGTTAKAWRDFYREIKIFLTAESFEQNETLLPRSAFRSVGPFNKLLRKQPGTRGCQ
jgi:hypothetical protein